MRSPSPSRLRSWSAVFLAATLGAGCVSHRHVVGLGDTGTGSTTARQYYLLFGFLQINEVDPRRMAADLTSYTIETQFGFVDLLLSPLLLVFTATSRTVTVQT